ncbi:prephenate dehydrogenase dimerization domain-containing protein [Limosilactobacillus fermentum]|uniref:prephenate dehydrogenase dimerization domain-containing protein n=1 Tax=Limosilactobacillus fermentum TaxID=1613 RepID=UPI002F26382A
MTRIVASDPTMWAAIMATNRDLISQQLASYLRELQRFKDLIDKQDQAGLFETFSKAQVRRNRLNQQSKDLFYDLFINIPDQVGAIAGVMSRLAAANVIHLQVLELRDEINGVLQLTFSTPADQRRAAGVLNDYEIIERGDQE